MPAPFLPENLRQSAALYAERCAIKDGSRTLCYAELWQSARAVAGSLIAHGFKPGERAAIALPNTVEYVQAVYGVLLAGGIAVPLNPAAKNRDFSAWIGHCEPSVIFARADNSELAAVLAHTRPQRMTVYVGDHGCNFAEVLRVGADAATLPACDRDQPAMIIYTSGTTGQPKGVTLSHANLASNTEAIIESLKLQTGDRIVNVLPFYFSYGNSVLHTHLSVGGCLVLEQNLVYPHKVVEALQNERATGFAGVPSTYALLMSRVKLESYDLSSLRCVTQAGGPMSTTLARQLQTALPHVDVFVMYGQTEATARITCLPPGQLNVRLGSVGVPIPGVQVHVRTEAGTLARPGEPGEIWVSGPNVMLGYWRDPAATEAVMQDGWLKTGDVGRIDDEGFVYLLGRRSDMIKSGANRIHPQDVEEVIAELPAVREVAVVGIDDELLGQVIGVFVVLHEDAELSPLQVRAHCRAQLASYKIPKYVVMVPALPKTASGKVRRHELAMQVSA